MKRVLKKAMTCLVSGLMLFTVTAGNLAFAQEEPLTREDYAAILAEYRQTCEYKIEIDWDVIYANYESGASEAANEMHLGKAIPEMNAEEFVAFLDEIQATMAEMLDGCESMVNSEGETIYYELDEIKEQAVYHNAEERAEIYDSMQLPEEAVEEIEAYVESSAMTADVSRTITTQDEQRLYYRSTDTVQDAGNHLYTVFTWVSVDGANRYSSYGESNERIYAYPAYVYNNVTCRFTNNMQNASCTYTAKVSYGVGILGETRSIYAKYTAGGGDIRQ